MNYIKSAADKLEELRISRHIIITKTIRKYNHGFAFISGKTKVGKTQNGSFRYACNVVYPGHQAATREFGPARNCDAPTLAGVIGHADDAGRHSRRLMQRVGGWHRLPLSLTVICTRKLAD